MLWLVANRWPIGTSTNSNKYEGMVDGGVSIAVFSELEWCLNNKPLFVKVCYQYHEVVKLHNEPTNRERQQDGWYGCWN